MTDPVEPLAEVLGGDPGAAGPDDLCELEGTLGVRDARDLHAHGAVIQAIGTASHSPFGDAIAALGTRVLSLAHEARRRLDHDRLPEGTGTPEQRERIDAARREGAADALGGEPAT
jgi:hypothetical protein